MSILLMVTAYATAGAQEYRPLRSVRVSQEASLAGMTIEFEIVEIAHGPTLGRFSATSGDVNRTTMERRYHCFAARGYPDEHSWRCAPDKELVDWKAVLSALDSAGIMDPPSDDTPRDMLCSDGAPWRVAVRRYSTRDSVVSHRTCGPRNQARITFERRIDSIITRVLDDVEHTAHTDALFHEHGIGPMAGLHFGLPGVTSGTLGLRLGLGDWLPGDIFGATEPGLLVHGSSAGYMLWESQYTGAGIVLRAARLKAWLPAPFVRREVGYRGGGISVLLGYAVGGRIAFYRGREPDGPTHWLATADIGIGF